MVNPSGSDEDRGEFDVPGNPEDVSKIGSRPSSYTADDALVNVEKKLLQMLRDERHRMEQEFLWRTAAIRDQLLRIGSMKVPKYLYNPETGEFQRYS